MAYLRLRRLLELAVLDRPDRAWLLSGRGGRDSREAPADYWDGLHRSGTYRNLVDGDRRNHLRLLASMVAERAPGGRVLEIGCGQGAFYGSLRTMRPSAYLGVDISGAAIAQAKSTFADDIAEGTARFIVGDGSDFADEDGFDAVIFADCIEYLGPLAHVLKHYGSLLSPSGFIGVTQWLAPHPLRMWRQIKTEVDLLDEALVCAPWGGAWQVWTGRPNLGR